MGEIASMIVHELNQPLTAIANFGEAAKRLVEAGGDPARAAGFMEKSVAQAHRASEMIRRLRSFVSRGPTEREPIAVNEVVRDAARLALIGAADQQIRTQLRPCRGPAGDYGRPHPGAAGHGEPDPQRRRCHARGRRRCVRRGALVVATDRTRRGAVLISVTDTGPGISAEVAADLFTPFVTTKTGGMGIGLSVSRSIVEAHGGRIWVEPAGERRHAGSPFTLARRSGRRRGP